MIAGVVRRVCVAIAFLLLAAPASWAQNGGSISGAVVDPLGARVSGAALKLMVAGKEVKSGTSDPMGDFTFDGLAEGRYQIEASSPGFQTRTTDPMFVGGNGRVTVDVALPIGPLEQNVSVTAAATDVLPSQIGAPVTVLDSSTIDALGKPDVLEGLRLVPGVSLVQTGARGGITSIFVRGGNSNFNKVLIDGIPANDIGGSVDLSQYSVAGIERIEAFRDPNSVGFGTDALSGVVSLVSKRGHVQDSRSVDLARRRQSRHASRVGVDRWDRAPLRLLQRVLQPRHRQRSAEQQYRTKTYAGRFGVALGHSSDLSGTVRWIDRRFETPNGMSFYGTPDDSFQNFKTMLYRPVVADADHRQVAGDGAVRLVGRARRFREPVALRHALQRRLRHHRPGRRDDDQRGQRLFGHRAAAPSTSARPCRTAVRPVRASTARRPIKLLPELSIAGGANFEREQGFPSANIEGDPTTTRNNHAVWVEGSGTLVHRVNITAGLGYAHNEVFENAYSPRLSVAAYLKAPSDEFWSDTRLTSTPAKASRHRRCSRRITRSTPCCSGRPPAPRWRRMPASAPSARSAAATWISASSRGCGTVACARAWPTSTMRFMTSSSR